MGAGAGTGGSGSGAEKASESRPRKSMKCRQATRTLWCGLSCVCVWGGDVWFGAVGWLVGRWGGDWI